MSNIPPEVHALLAVQHGVVARSQLLAAGLSDRQIEYVCHRGDLVVVLRGAFRSPSTCETEAARCAAVSLARPLAVIAGPTAGRLWGFRHVGRDRRIHAIVPRGRRVAVAPWCVAYRTDALDPADVVERHDGIRMTSRARTALDLARHLPDDDRLLSVIEQAVHDGSLRDRELRAIASGQAGGRRWVRRFVEQLDRRLDGPAAESEPEVRVGRALADVGITDLVRQWCLDLPGVGSVRFDLAVPDVRWALEVDVFPTHRETVGRRNDAERDRSAAAIGWRVERISADEYRQHFDASIARVAADLAATRRRSA